MQNWIETRGAHEPRTAVVDPDRCVLAIAIEASCRACVEICPREAFIDGVDALRFDTEACDGCAICVAACPRGAIAIERTAIAISPNDARIGFAACEQAAGRSKKGVMPCLHAIGLDELAQLYSEGLRRLYLTYGNCVPCKPLLKTKMDATLDRLKRLLADRDLEPLNVVTMGGMEWERALAEHLAPSRRGLLNLFRPSGIEQNSNRQQTVKAAGILRAGNSAEPLNPFHPKIDPSACNGCNACARICPEAAIEVIDQGTGRASYSVRSSLCSGCGLCTDVCDRGAVSVGRWQRGGIAAIRLDSRQCSRCGNVFHYPMGHAPEQGSAQSLCRICAGTKPNKHLFQIIE